MGHRQRNRCLRTKAMAGRQEFLAAKVERKFGKTSDLPNVLSGPAGKTACKTRRTLVAGGGDARTRTAPASCELLVLVEPNGAPSEKFYTFPS